MGAIVSVKERARKKTMAITAFGSHIYQDVAIEKVNKTNQRFTEENSTTTEGKGSQRGHRKVGNGKSSSQNHGLKTMKTGKDSSTEITDEKTRSSGILGERFMPASQNGNIDDNENRFDAISEDRKNEIIGLGSEQCTWVASDINIIKTQDHSRTVNNRSATDYVDHNNQRSDAPETQSHTEDPSYQNCHGDLIYNMDKIDKQILTSRGAVDLRKTEDNQVLSRYKHVQEWFRAMPSESSDSTPNTPIHVALGSWGEGVIGISDHNLQSQGLVTSRGMQTKVQSSALMYDSIVRVSPTPQPEEQKPGVSEPKSVCKGWEYGCICEKCIAERKRRKAALIIQKLYRGHQVRRTLLKQRKSIIKIQRLFRKRVESSEKLEFNINKPSTPELQERIEKSKPRNRIPSPTPSFETQVPGKAKENFELYQDDITELKWKSQQLIEQATMGDDYIPQTLLLIASNVGQTSFLARATHEDVNVIVYQFSEITLNEILQNILLALNDYKNGSKAKRIAFVCQGGPGYMYLCRGKALTTAKLSKDNELHNFVKVLGTYMSKLDPDNVKIHVIGNNICGNKKGVKLIENVTEVIKPSRVSIESPLEQSAAGKQMLEEYFDIEKYKVWKRIKHTKIWI